MKKLTCLCLALAACTSDDAIDFMGHEPTQAAVELAELDCAMIFECGVLEFHCPDNLTMPESDESGCTLDYIPASTEFANETACISQLADDYRELFVGCAVANLGDSERSAVNDCLNQERRCLTESERAVIVAGGRISSQACLRAEPVFEVCDLCEEDPDAPDCR